MKILILSATVLIGLTGCQTASQRSAEVTQAVRSESNLSVASVQAKIEEGMSSAEVIEALGTPNIITTDRERREVWTYDKVATETVSASSSGGTKALLLGGIGGGTGALAGGIGGSQSSSATASRRSDRTLTIIIKFSDTNLVRDFAYRYTTF
jgi:putative NADH-flavin reductase